MISLRTLMLPLLLITTLIYSQEVQLGFGTIDNNNVEITINNESAIAGFQFDVGGSNLSGASGGLAAQAGFTVSVGGSTVLGFSFTGSTIPSGSSGVLTNLSGNFSDDICLELGNGAISDPSGNAIDVSFGDFDCNGVEPPCDDADADGICDDVDDCVGLYDECGICNGDGPSYECWNGSFVCESSECPIEDGGTSLGFGSVSDNTMEIQFDSSSPVAGFQFEITGAQLYNASGGLAAQAGFTVSVGGSTVIGFSLTGGTVEGSGVLTNLSYEAIDSQACITNVVLSDPSGNAMDYEVGSCVDLNFEEPCDDADADGICDDVDDCVGEYDECGVCNGDGIADGACDCDGNVEDCAGQCGGNAEIDECGICGGDNSSCAPVYIGFGNVGGDTLEILINNPADVAGFQFDIDGATLNGALGGLAQDAGFTVSVGGNTVIGFSLTGSVIPSGSDGVLTNLNYTAVNEDACISNVVLSDPSGNALDTIVGDCVVIIEPVLGCTDSDACNYDENANVDDGSCDYAEENFDCDGNCTIAVDCNGECGGDAIEDCDGICNGDNLPDNFGVCNGDNTIQGAINFYGEGADLIVPSGTYAESILINYNNVNLICNAGTVIDVRGLPSGITVAANDISIDGCEIIGDDSTVYGIVVTPPSQGIKISDNKIHGMALANPSNDSPLAYGILAYGSGFDNMPQDLSLERNEIFGVAGAGISLGAYTNSTIISENYIHDLIPVEYLGQQLSVGKYYLKRNNPTAAMRRLKKIKSSTKDSTFLPEVSYRLIESLILVGLFPEAISENRYMKKKFPNSSWAREASALIKKSGLD